MAEVIISGPLRIYTEGRKKLSIQGETVWDVILSLSEQYPLWKDKLIRNEKLSMQTTITVNNRDIRLLDNENTKVDINSTLFILPTLVGG
jgi:molybdopterin converting factor small subunit